MEEADQLCDRIGIMDHGKILALGTPAELKRSVGPTPSSRSTPTAISPPWPRTCDAEVDGADLGHGARRLGAARRARHRPQCSSRVVAAADAAGFVVRDLPVAAAVARDRVHQPDRQGASRLTRLASDHGAHDRPVRPTRSTVAASSRIAFAALHPARPGRAAQDACASSSPRTIVQPPAPVLRLPLRLPDHRAGIGGGAGPRRAQPDRRVRVRDRSWSPGVVGDLDHVPGHPGRRPCRWLQPSSGTRARSRTASRHPARSRSWRSPRCCPAPSRVCSPR